VNAGHDSAGLGLIVSSSRAIIYASSGADFAEAAARAAESTRDEIRLVTTG
jgi:orotidine-5'-phosphate decarboxylase